MLRWRLSSVLVSLKERIHEVSKLVEEAIVLLLLLRLLKPEHILVVDKTGLLLLEQGIGLLVSHAIAEAERTKNHENYLN